MKTISLMQPWASLIILGVKQFETRSWDTKHRGRLLIHASQKKDPAYAQLCVNSPFNKFIKGLHGFYALPFGAIIGEVKLEETFDTENLRRKISDTEQAFGDYGTGRRAWKLVKPMSYQHIIPYKGALSIWEFPDELLVDANH